MYAHAMNDTLTFGEWLSDQLHERGMSQKALAESVGVSNTAVSTWINNEKRPTRRSCWGIADALGLHRQVVMTAAGYGPGPIPADTPIEDMERTLNTITDERFVMILNLAASNPSRFSYDAKADMMNYIARHISLARIEKLSPEERDREIAEWLERREREAIELSKRDLLISGGDDPVEG